jgi:hypothetical protein
MTKEASSSTVKNEFPQQTWRTQTTVATTITNNKNLFCAIIIMPIIASIIVTKCGWFSTVVTCRGNNGNTRKH